MINSLLSPNKRGAVIFIDLPDFFQPVDIRLTDVFNPSRYFLIRISSASSHVIKSCFKTVKDGGMIMAEHFDI